MCLRAFCRADVNSDFSANVDESIPYDFSSDLSSESFIDEMSGRLDMVESVLIPLLAETNVILLQPQDIYESDDKCKNDEGINVKSAISCSNSYVNVESNVI